MDMPANNETRELRFDKFHSGEHTHGSSPHANHRHDHSTHHLN